MNDRELKEFAESRVGTCIRDKWTLERLLGVGGTASVYSATHRNGNRVAVKILHPELASQGQFRERFLREGYVGNAIEHPGAVTVHDDDTTEDGCACLVMDLLEGENLEARRVRKGGRLACAEVLSLMDDVLDTLAIAHATGIVHRDIKPENLFLTTDNQVKLLDFGIARIDVPENPGKTMAGIAMGTPAFMPAEQASAHWKDVDAQSDVWAIGASMFTMLTGRFVHDGGTVNESLAMAVTKEAPAIASIASDVAAPVAYIVDKALKRDKSQRWGTARELQNAIRLTYRELQEGNERYSLSSGIAAHSLPPSDAIEQAPAMIGTPTDEPVSAELAMFKPRSHRLWVVAGALSAVAALLIIWLVRAPDARSGKSPIAATANAPESIDNATGALSPQPSDAESPGSSPLGSESELEIEGEPTLRGDSELGGDAKRSSDPGQMRPAASASKVKVPVTDVGALKPESTAPPPTLKPVRRRPRPKLKKAKPKPEKPATPFDPFATRD